MKRIFLPALVVLVANASARDFDFSKYSTKVRNFISDVAFEVEAGDREKYSKRLAPAIDLTVHGDVVQKTMVEAKIAPFLAASGVTSNGPAPDGTRAKIDVYFGDSGTLTPVAAGISKDISLDLGATYWTWWTDGRVINRAVIFICTDKIAANRIEDKVVEKLLAVFGFPSTSRESDQSCLAASDPNFVTLQPLDVALIKFYYKEVPAGTKPSELDKIVREKW